MAQETTAECGNRATQRLRQTGSAVMNNRATRDEDQKGGRDNDRGVQVRPHCQPKTVRAEGDVRAPMTAGRPHRSRPLKECLVEAAYCPARPR